MSAHTRLMKYFLTVFLGLLSVNICFSASADIFELYTPFRTITVPPGESIDYPIEVINNTQETKTVFLVVSGIPRTWNYSLKYGSYDIRQISVLPGEKKSVSLKVDVPLQVNKGHYGFQVTARDLFTLPLTVTVSEQGTFKTEFTSTQANMEGVSTSTFSFETKLRNSTAERQHYGLSANVPAGWIVTFRPNFRQATSVDIDANSEANISIDIDPPDRVQAGTYKIPVRASTSGTSATLDLEVVITGTYGMTLTTPTGLLSTTVTAGDTRNIDLVINNTGSTQLSNISLGATTPLGWEVTFDPEKIDIIAPGKSGQVSATLKVDKKAIAGDYVTRFNAVAPETTSEADFRVTVRTPMIWGWLGIFIIIGALGIVYYLFRKYGRR